MAAKSRLKKKAKKVKATNAADAKSTGRFFAITGLVVGVILLALFLVFNSL